MINPINPTNQTFNATTETNTTTSTNNSTTAKTIITTKSDVIAFGDIDHDSHENVRDVVDDSDYTLNPVVGLRVCLINSVSVF